MCMSSTVEIENLKVTEMRVEYFPLKEDVILQNEAPTDLYIVVTGAAVRIYALSLFPFTSYMLCVVSRKVGGV